MEEYLHLASTAHDTILVNHYFHHISHSILVCSSWFHRQFVKYMYNWESLAWSRKTYPEQPFSKFSYPEFSAYGGPYIAQRRGTLSL